MLAKFIDGADVGMIQRGRGPCLALKSLQGPRIAPHLFGKELQRHGTAQLQVFGAVHYSHATAAQDRQNSIVRDRLAGQTCRFQPQLRGSPILAGDSLCNRCGLGLGDRQWQRSQARYRLDNLRRRRRYGLGGNRRQKTISPPGNCLHIDRSVRVVVQHGPYLLDALVQPVIEVDVGLIAPDLLLNFLAGDELAGLAGKKCQNPEWLRGQLEGRAIFAQFFAVEIELEYPEAEKSLRGAQHDPLTGRSSSPDYTSRSPADVIVFLMTYPANS